MDPSEALARVKKYAEQYGVRAAGRVLKIHRNIVSEIINGKYPGSGKRMAVRFTAADAAKGEQAMNALPLNPNERLWRAMRSLRSFTIPELVQMSGATRQETKNLVVPLTHAGIMMREAITRTDKRGKLPNYRLVRDQGPNFIHASYEVGLP